MTEKLDYHIREVSGRDDICGEDIERLHSLENDNCVLEELCENEGLLAITGQETRNEKQKAANLFSHEGDTTASGNAQIKECINHYNKGSKVLSKPAKKIISDFLTLKKF
jgi:hypothetical protein